MDLDEGNYGNSIKKESWRTVLTLAYQSLGVVYGDLSISPLYVYKSAFAEDIEHSETNEEIFGVLSFVFWTLTLVPLLKYVFIVLRADDNGEGGTFALYSLLCRHARVGLLPNGQIADEELSAYKKTDGICHDHCPGSGEAGVGGRFTAAARLKTLMEKHRVLRQLLLVLALIGTCMVIGDGVLTPSLSVFSAVSGLELSMSKEHHKYLEVPIACLILICLFAVQHYGTHRVGFLFAPIVITWLLCISMIGIYNIFYWNPHVYHALSPYYMYKFLKKTQRQGWMSLGGILLCIIGSEAMFADLGHFSQLSIKIAFTSVVYPALILAYMGQAAYLSQHHILESDYRIGFYVSVPGLAIITVMLVTTCLMSLVIILCWCRGVVIAMCFFVFFGAIEALYFTSALIKFREGAWVPIVFSFIFMIIMYVWHYGTLEKYEFDLQNKVSINWLLSLGPSLGIVRVRGIGLIHSELVSGIPAIFSHFVTNLPAFHQVLVFLCIKSVPVPHVRPQERFLVGRIGPREYRIYRCVVRYGYHDIPKDDIEFEKDLVCSIAAFIQSNGSAEPNRPSDDSVKENEKVTMVNTGIYLHEKVEENGVYIESGDLPGPSKPQEIQSPVILVKKKVSFVLPKSPKMDNTVREELRDLMEAREAGVAFITGNSYMRAKSGSSFVKKLAIALYDFLRRNSRGPSYAMSVPHATNLEVGMVYLV
ncbi:hypothetical protein KFK09_015340 [Dendrobium nobile]|uniref:Potassium transporter n=1 Tax=Dendrobium nobile TaxID=94219 RepID=A0A8T3B5M0_DENNO|nr:hypothetical protein KFK09_015340 [Dendrobium nobile]